MHTKTGKVCTQKAKLKPESAADMEHLKEIRTQKNMDSFQSISRMKPGDFFLP